MDAIFHRTSIRKYKKQKVEKEKIIQILKAAMQAPSACNQQPWSFYVVTDSNVIEQLSKTSPYASFTKEAPVIIVSTYKLEGLMAPEYAQIDMSIAQENMWLESDALGLGGVWIGTCPQQVRMDAVKEVLHLAENEHAFALFALGYPDEDKQQEDRFDESRIHYIGE